MIAALGPRIRKYGADSSTPAIKPAADPTLPGYSGAASTDLRQ